MLFSLLATVVCLICHGGPADHFATFIEKLPNDIGAIEIYASGPALKKFQERKITVTTSFSIDDILPEKEDALAEHIAKACSHASIVITDVGHAFDIKVQKAIARQAPHVQRFAYYDNPEPYVPGGYSAIAFEVMQAAQTILFANANLAKSAIFQCPGKEVNLINQQKIGIGYYPIHQAEKIAQRRSREHSLKRQAFFEKNALTDQGQKVLVYFGGNNEEYVSKALPAFLSLLEEGMMHSDFTQLVIIFQQHPGARTGARAKNIDRKLIEYWMNTHKEDPLAPKMVISDFNSDEAQTLADGILYYQTSMGPLFVLAGIPTMQIGHETYEDILIKNQLSPSITKSYQLIQAIDSLNHPKEEISQKVIFEALGIKINWLHILEMTIKSGYFPI